MSGPSGHGREVLLTGATGFVGKVVLAQLLRRREALGIECIHVLVRASEGGAEGRFEHEVAGSPALAGLPEGWRRHVRVVPGDLLQEGAGLAPSQRAELALRLTQVLHVAASVDFELPVAEAEAVNVEGSLHLLELARRCPRLERMVSVSTAYVTPHPGPATPVRERLAALPRDAESLRAEIREGRVDEARLLAESGHPNTYTLTKCLAEHLLLGRRGSVPLAIVRPSIISASRRHPEPGWIDSAAAFAGFVALVGTGHLRAVAADPDSRVDLVPVDEVAESILDVAFDARLPRDATPIVHAVAGFERSPTIAQCRAWLTDFFRRHPVGRRPHVPYLGPPGAWLRLAHWRHHELPLALAALVSKRARRGRRVLRSRIAALNRSFVYFTHHSFDFRTSRPALADFEPRAYVETVCRGIHRHLLRCDAREVPVAGRRGPDLGGNLRFVWRQPEGGGWIRLAGWLVTKTLRRCTERVTLDLRSFEAARGAIPAGVSWVLVPSHRSYLDFVLCSYLGFARPDLGFGVPRVAASAEFARIPLLGPVLDDLGAFYVRRGLGREDKELSREVHQLVRAGHVLEFFIEGGRSRTRAFLPPRRGMVRCLQATGERFALLPVAISYDRVPEEAGFLRELAGAGKPPMRLRDLLGWTLRMLRGRVELGRVHIACGSPVMLDLSRDVKEVSREVLAELQRATITTRFHLEAFRIRAGLEDVSLAVLEQALRARGGRVLRSPLRAGPELPAALETSFRHHFAHLFFDEARRMLGGHPAVEAHLRRHAWASGGSVRSAPDDGLGPRLVRALFEPVCRDYARTATALGSPAEPLAVAEPRALVRREPSIALEHAEGAFEDLLRRGVLARLEGSGRCVWGPRREEVGLWRTRYAWPERALEPRPPTPLPQRGRPSLAAPGAPS